MDARSARPKWSGDLDQMQLHQKFCGGDALRIFLLQERPAAPERDQVSSWWPIAARFSAIW
jgi:hypothetical protein